MMSILMVCCYPDTDGSPCDPHISKDGKLLWTLQLLSANANFLASHKIWILYSSRSRRAHDLVTIGNPMSTLHMALLSIML